jgi:hypothetical protein
MSFTAFNQGKPSSRLPNKILLIMKMVTFIMFAILMQASAYTYSQITIHHINTPISKVLSLVKKQTGYVFLVKDYELSKVNVSLNVDNAGITEVLDACFKNLPVSYKIVDKTIFIQVKENKLLSEETLLIKNLDVGGRIVDDKGQPLPGATIRVKNTTMATSANIEGYFSLKNVPASATLVISFTGYLTQEVNVGDKATVNITLLEDTKSLNDVVVVGYGTQKKVNLTGAVAMVTAEALESRPITSVSTGLQGLIPGLTAVSFSGQPGATNATRACNGYPTRL